MERSREELDTRLKRQIQFIVEVDKVKNIFRQTYLADANRKENDAECTSKDTARIKQCLEIIQSHPVKQHQMIVDLAVIRKCHTDHEDQRQNCKSENKNHRWCHQKSVQIFMKQRF